MRRPLSGRREVDKSKRMKRNAVCAQSGWYGFGECLTTGKMLDELVGELAFY